MHRRDLLKGAFALAAGAAAARFATDTVAAPAAPTLVGTGCRSCRPDLFPAHDAPAGPSHFAVDWTDWHRSMGHPPIKVGGVAIPEVVEFDTGYAGWLIANHRDESLPDGSSKGHLCQCGAKHLQMDRWEGTVEAPGVFRLTDAQIVQGNIDSAARMERWARERERWDRIDAYIAAHPEDMDGVFGESDLHPDEVPTLVDGDLAWVALEA